MTKIGKIIPNGVSLEKHENETVVYFTNLGYNVELIKPSNSPKLKSPDFIMGNKEWEMKSPQGDSRVTVEHAFKRAAKQSQNIIIDLRRTKMTTAQAESSLIKLFKSSRRVRNLKIITKEQKLVEYKK